MKPTKEKFNEILVSEEVWTGWILPTTLFVLVLDVLLAFWAVARAVAKIFMFVGSAIGLLANMIPLWIRHRRLTRERGKQ